MLLAQETLTRFGYDGTQWGPTSTKKVVVKCDVCGTVRETYARSANLPCQACACALKPNQRKEGRVYHSKVGITSAVLIEETIAAFGYDPTKLTKGSNRPVLRKCGGCGKVERKPFRQGLYPCSGCAVSEKFRAKRESNAAQGLSSRGIPLATMKANLRAYYSRKAVEYGRTPLGSYRARLQASMRSMLKRGYGKTKHFSYTVNEFRDHIEGLLKEFGNCCPICRKPLNGSFQIDHKIPLYEAKDEKRMLELFALDNLWPVCQHCNVAVKRNKRLEEILPVSEFPVAGPQPEN